MKDFTSVTCEYCGEEIYTATESDQVFQRMTRHWRGCPGIPAIDQLSFYMPYRLKTKCFAKKSKDNGNEKKNNTGCAKIKTFKHRVKK